MLCSRHGTVCARHCLPIRNPQSNRRHERQPAQERPHHPAVRQEMQSSPPGDRALAKSGKGGCLALIGMSCRTPRIMGGTSKPWRDGQSRHAALMDDWGQPAGCRPASRLGFEEQIVGVGDIGRKQAQVVDDRRVQVRRGRHRIVVSRSVRISPGQDGMPQVRQLGHLV